jgi:hypothetical protein
VRSGVDIGEMSTAFLISHKNFDRTSVFPTEARAFRPSSVSVAKTWVPTYSLSQIQRHSRASGKSPLPLSATVDVPHARRIGRARLRALACEGGDVCSFLIHCLIIIFRLGH